MTATFLPLPPVIDQTIQRVPLDPWSSVAFACTTLASVWLAYRRSPLILAVLAFAVPFAAYRDVGNTTLTIEKCVAFGTAIGLVASGVTLLPPSRAARRVFFAASVLLVSILLSLFHARFPIEVAREFLKQAEYLVLFWCAMTIIQQVPRADRSLYLGLAAATLIVSTLAVSQAIIGGAPSGIWINGHPLPRVAGPLEGPNQLAGFLEAALPLLWITPLLAGRLHPLFNYVIAASCAALVLTQSRAGIIVATVSYLGLVGINGRLALRSLPPILIGTAVGLAVVGAWFIFWAHASLADVANFWRFAATQNPGGVGTRSQLWRAAFALFDRSPLTGVGAGNFEFLLPTVGLHGVQTQAGSLWLQTLAEQGLIGLCALIFFAFTALRETWRLQARSPLALAGFLALASLLAHQLVDDLFFFPKVGAIAWLLLGAATADPARRESAKIADERVPPGVTPVMQQVGESS